MRETKERADAATRRPGLAVGLLSGLLASVAIPGHAPAQPASVGTATPGRIAFDIPAQDLNRGVLIFAQRAGIQVFYDTAKLGGRRSSAVSGTLTPQEALGRMLAGTGLAYRFTAPRQVTIVDPSAAGAGHDGGGPPGTIPLDPIDVQASGTVGYVATASTAGTKTDTPLIETPQSVTVVTRQELDDRNVQTLTEAVAYTPGVRTGQSGYDPRYDSFTIRGFDTTYNGIYRDGLRLPGSNMAVFKVEPYGVENVTVLRGPSSALYGLGSPGGLVDITSKRPTEKAFGEVEVRAGNYDLWQGQFDTGGPVDKDGTLLYRLTGLLRDAGSPNVLGGGVNDAAFVAPAFTYKPNDSTRITFLGEYLKYETPASLPYYAWTGSGADAFSKTPGDYNSLKQTQYRVGYLAEHDVNNSITVRQKLRYGYADTSVRYTGETSFDAATNTASRYSGYVHDKLDSFVVDNQLQAKFATGAVEHTLLVGVDYSHLGLDSGIGYGTASDYNYTLEQALGPVYDPEFNASRFRQKQNQLGVYVQEQAKFGGFILTLTGRHDRVETTNDDLLTSTTQDLDDKAFTGRAGLTYRFDNGIAPYVSYSTSFAPNLGTDISGNSFVPTTARQIEGGVKYAPAGFDGYVAASVFQIDQDKGLVTDETNPVYQVQTGEVRGRGFELEGVANLGAGLKLRGAYAYLDLTNMAGDPETIGLTPSGQPQHSFSVWADYQFQPGTVLAGLGVGAGVRYTGSTWGNALNTFQNSAYALVDAKLSYDLVNLGPQLKGWSMQVNLQNLLDEDYITCDAGYCYQGRPLTVTGGVKYRW
ncbi:TonB-dependent siderophore receptor [Rhodoplanes sp. TEM]|uniref:TonB-dependent siderophore receptor n=1 Tax=Rhodoplanes tepidamans TaxID=200616 RepID=A0ABT5J8B0_RHOTP|nr:MULTISPECIES: TonB-dependent siderophore receptor [Rhodoplanes]MDC7785880.1 TonB-dependent siderophore receptor [Rhodoplanes tepidamans]MDC7984992.1 TonB-dependent siderophore receptor [Rhodoplanes sp. TEM]MDQ0355502.1 iron complex outermembrane receptor protein [Rhodoplanes tepidamans]